MTPTEQIDRLRCSAGMWREITGHSCPLLYDLEEPKPKETK